MDDKSNFAGKCVQCGKIFSKVIDLVHHKIEDHQQEQQLPDENPDEGEDYFDDENFEESIDITYNDPIKVEEDLKSEFLDDSDNEKFESTEQCIRSSEIKGFEKTIEEQTEKQEQNKAERWSYQCNLCQKKYTQSHNLKLHINKVHEGNYTQSHISKVHESTKSIVVENTDKTEEKITDDEKLEDQLYDEDYEETEEIIHECEFCGKTFKVSSNLKRHISNAHKDLKLPKEKKKRIRKKDTTECFCKICEKTIRGTHNFRLHVRAVHEGEKNHICEECGKGFFKNPSLLEHIKFPKNFKCLEKFKNSEKYYEGMKLEKRIRKHKKRDDTECFCETCGKSFRGTSNLKSHVQSIHEGIKSHICANCGKGFFRKATLIEHLQYANNFKCLEIFKLSSDEVLPPKRIRKHKYTRKEVICDSCGKTLQDSSGLKAHMRAIHEGEREHVCGTCGKAFFRKNQMEEHIGNYYLMIKKLPQKYRTSLHEFIYFTIFLFP